MPKDKLVPVLVVMVVVASFAVGMLYGKVQVYEKNLGPGTQQAAVGDPQAPQGLPAEDVPLTGDQWENVLAGVEFMKGDESAPVTMVEFLDYRCGFCGRYFEETYPQIEKDYVDTGKIKYGMIALPFLGPESAKAAEAALCAADQQGDEGYFTYHNLLFENAASLSQEVYGRLATDMGLNAGRFNDCLDNGAKADQVEKDLALAREVGVSGTPSFLINGEVMVGAQPYSEFKTVLDRALGE